MNEYWTERSKQLESNRAKKDAEFSEMNLPAFKNMEYGSQSGDLKRVVSLK